MNTLPGRQKGASAIVTIIILAALAYGVFVGIQYVPQRVESGSIDSILNNIETQHKSSPLRSEEAARAKVISMLQVNEMNDMTDSFTVKRVSGGVDITFSYDRELNLGYKKHTLHYEKSVSLR